MVDGKERDMVFFAKPATGLKIPDKSASLLIWNDLRSGLLLLFTYSAHSAKLARLG
jgi:hypothetical protein